MNKEKMNEQVRETINEVLNKISLSVDKKLEDKQLNPETLLTLTRALETGLCTAQRFDFISGKCGGILFDETEDKLCATVKNITDLIIRVLTNYKDVNADELMQFITMLNITSIAWKRLYSFGEDNPYC